MSKENDEVLVQILGEISALRYVVEILLARDLAAFEPDDAKAGANTILRLARTDARLSEDATQEHAMEITVQTTASLERLLERALEHADSIRRAQ